MKNVLELAINVLKPVLLAGFMGYVGICGVKFLFVEAKTAAAEVLASRPPTLEAFTKKLSK